MDGDQVATISDPGIAIDAKLSLRGRLQKSGRERIVASRLIVTAVVLTLLVRGFMAFWSVFVIAPVTGGTYDWVDQHITHVHGYLMLVLFLEYPVAVALGIQLLVSAHRVRLATQFRSAVPALWPSVLTVLYVIPSLATVGEHGDSTVFVIPLILAGSAVALGLVLYARYLLPDGPTRP